MTIQSNFFTQDCKPNLIKMQENRIFKKTIYYHSVVGFTLEPFRICPQPMSLQCFSTLRLRAIFSPIEVQTGVVNPILAKSALTAITRPPADKEPMLTIRTSFLLSLETLAPFLSPSTRTPSNLLNK